ncbi:hypothetical protein ANO14919_059410 [Xylariales sp. No.14919]|nr:hypothetical protein ANO14919_059410 [Xylariales sp. No.14919]
MNPNFQGEGGSNITPITTEILPQSLRAFRLVDSVLYLKWRDICVTGLDKIGSENINHCYWPLFHQIHHTGDLGASSILDMGYEVSGA